jgi:hypothetical protein
LLTSDFGLFFISFIFTTYFLRWKQWRSVQESRIDDRIENLMTLTLVMDGNSASGNGNGSASGNDNDDSDGTATATSPNFEMLIFNAQLALAMMESQRIMQNGNYGRDVNDNDGDNDGNNNRVRGISNDKKQQWQIFHYNNEDNFYAFLQQTTSTNNITMSTNTNTNHGTGMNMNKKSNSNTKNDQTKKENKRKNKDKTKDKK